MQAATLALVCLREHTTYVKLAAGFRISEGTAHACVQSVIGHLASRAPSLTQVLRRARSEYVLVDGTIAECDRVGDRERDYSGKARRHGVNIQAVTDPVGELIWYSPALPGRTVDITAARTHHIVTICERLRIPVLADKAYVGASGTFEVPFKRHLRRPLTTRQAAVNRTRTAPLPRRAGLRPAQGLADLPQSPDQPQPTHVNHQGRTHPRETTLKILSKGRAREPDRASSTYKRNLRWEQGPHGRP